MLIESFGLEVETSTHSTQELEYEAIASHCHRLAGTVAGRAPGQAAEEAEILLQERKHGHARWLIASLEL